MAAGFPVKEDYANGDVLTATNLNDLAGTVNLIQAPLGNAAGKNKIINGDFGINQRAFTSITTTGQYGFDRWALGNASNFGTVTYTPQNFTLGAAPVAGYEGTTFARITTTGQTQTGVRTALRQPIESVRTLANSTVTVSFWAKAASGTPKIAVDLEQQFGTGGSPSANVDNYLGQATLSTSWARYSLTGSIASISGKTIGTNNNDLLMLHLVVSAGSDYNSSTGSLGIQSNTFDFWGVQVEAGSVVTPFQTATGTKQGELAACQRYYWRSVSGGAYGVPAPSGYISSTTNAILFSTLPVPMRVAPTSIEFSTMSVLDAFDVAIVPSTVTLNTARTTTTVLSVDTPLVGGTAGRFAYGRINNSTSGYLAASAEL